MFVATWNVGNRAPSPSELEVLFADGKDADIVVFGAQESNYKLTPEMKAQCEKGYHTKRGDKAARKLLQSADVAFSYTC